MSTITWTGLAGDGNFNNPNNWSPKQVPGAADTAIITPAAATAISLGANQAVANLTTSAKVTLGVSNQQSLTLGAGFTTSMFSNGGTFELNSSNQNTDLVLGAATTTLTGGGVILLDSNPNNAIFATAATDILSNVNNIIEGSGQLGAGTLTLSNGAAGIINGNQGNALVLNTGTAKITNAGLLESTAGGALVIQSVVNNGTAGHVTAAGGTVYLQGGDLQGGTLSTSGGGSITVQGGFSATLDGTAKPVANTGTVAVNNQGTLSVLGSIVNTGIIALQSSNQNTDLVIGPLTGTAGTVTLSGTGTLTLSDNGSNRIYGGEAGDTLLNQSTIAGAGAFGVGTLTLTNQGTIDATGGNGLVVNTGSTVINDALMEATNPLGGLVLQATVNDSAAGTLLAAGATVYLQGADIIGGLLSSTGSAAITVQGGQVATLDGSAHTVTNAGQFAINNQGTLSVLGTLTNTGTLALQSSNQNTELVVASPTLTLNGGGVITLSDNGGNYIFGNTAATVLNNVNNTIEGSGQIGAGTLTLINAGTIDATGGAAYLYINGGTTVTNTALMEATGTAGLVIQNTSVADGTTGTLAAVNSDVFLQNTTVSGGLLKSATGFAIDIQGGQVATLNGVTNAVTSTGSIALNNQATLTLLGSLINKGTLSLGSTNQATELFIGSSTVTLSGGGAVTLSDNPANYILGSVAADRLYNVDNTISGAGNLGAGRMGLINGSKGVIDANASNTLTLSTGGAVVSNNGLIESTGSGGLLILNTSVSTGGSGSSVLANGGNIVLNGGLLTGSTVTTSAGGEIVIGGSTIGTLSAITLAGTLAVQNQGTLSLLGAIVDKGLIQLNSTNQNTDLIVGPQTGSAGTVTLSGAGTLTLTDNLGNRIYGGQAGDTLSDTNVVIQGAGQLGAGTLKLVNHSTIDATGGSGLVVNTGSTVINDALMEATNPSGGLVIQSRIDSSGGGTILAGGGTVYLQGGTLAGGIVTSTGTSSINVQGGYIGNLDGSTQAVTNTGAITLSNQGTLGIEGSIVNDASIALNSGNQYTDLIVQSAAATLTGNGTIVLSDNGGNRIYGALGTDVLDNVNNTIAGAGQIGAAQLTLTNSGTIDATGGNALVINTGTVTATNTKLMEATGSGGLVVQTTIDSSGGGTILAAGGNVYLQGGTLAGGTVNSSGGAALVASGGTLDGSAHALTNLGTVLVTNQNTLTLLGSIVNSNVIELNSTNQNTDLISGSATLTLSGGGTILLSDNGGNRIYGSVAADVIDNVNNTIEGAGQLGAGQLTFINTGTIDATGGNALIINTGSIAVTNSKLMEATGSGGLVVQTTIDSSTGGTILAAGGNVYLQGGGTLAGGTFNSTGTSALVSTGGTLDGSAHALTNLGTAVLNNQNTLTVLGAIVNAGVIALESTNQATDLILGSPTLTLSGGGTITLSDNGGNRIYGAVAADVLNNVNNTIEGAGQLGAGQLTLIDSGTIAATGGNALLLNLRSTGTITATGALLGIGTGGLSIQAGTYTNSGLIEAQNNSSVTFAAGSTLTNIAAGTLTGGTYEALSTGQAATLNFDTAGITTDNATIILSGTAANVDFNGAALSAGLTTIGKTGTLELLAGAAYSTAQNLTDYGKIILAGGSLNARNLFGKPFSSVSGYGTVAASINTVGSLAATGGTLDLSGHVKVLHGPITGTGTLALDGGSTTLSSGATLGVSTLALIDAGKLSLATNLTFASVFDLVGKVSVSGTATATNTGLLSQTGTGTASFGAALTNSGTIAIGAGGGIAFTGGLTNTGLITDNGILTDTAPLTGGSLAIGAFGASASIATTAGSGPSTLATLTLGGGKLATTGTTLTVTGDYNNTASGVGNSYSPFKNVTGTIDGKGTQLAVVGVDGTTISNVNGTLTIAIAPNGTANFVIENTGASGSAALRGALETTVNGGHITGRALTGSGVTAQNFGPIAAGSESGTYSIAYSHGTLSGEAIHLQSDFANVAGLTIDIVAAPQAPHTAGAGMSSDYVATHPLVFSLH